MKHKPRCLVNGDVTGDLVRRFYTSEKTRWCTRLLMETKLRMRAPVLFIRNGLVPSPWQRYERHRQQQQQQQHASVKGININDIHRVLTPRVGQRKTSSTASGSNSTPPPRRLGSSSPGIGGGRRRMRLKGGRGRLGRRRNSGGGTRRKSGRSGRQQQTCTCPPESWQLVASSLPGSGSHNTAPDSHDNLYTEFLRCRRRSLWEFRILFNIVISNSVDYISRCDFVFFFTIQRQRSVA